MIRLSSGSKSPTPRGGAGPLLQLVFFLLVSQVSPCFGLEPAEILVVYNRNLPQSAELARYYQQKRALPADNLFGLPLPDKEFIDRSDYERLLARPLREKLSGPHLRDKITALLLIYGVPLKVGPALPPAKGWEDTLREQRQATGSQLLALLTRLETIVDLQPAAAEDLPEREKIEKRWKDVESQLPVWQRQHDKDEDFPAQSAEVQALLLRLSGIGRVARSLPEKKEKPRNRDRRDRLELLHSLVDQQLNLFLFTGVTSENLLSAASLQQVNSGLIGAYSFLSAEQKQIPDAESSASVDSELSLLLRPFFRTGHWLANPHAQQYDAMPGIAPLRKQTLMVCRLDAPEAGIVRRLVDDALHAESHGLSGKFYIDARGLAGKGSKTDYYREYDQHLEKLYSLIKDQSPLPVVFDHAPELFRPHADLPAALYVGWYSMGRYIDSFAWQRGAIGFHVASAEAKTLRDRSSTVWCKMMLEKGVAATIGPTEEPYLQSFPLPDQFFPLLFEGKLGLLEIYYRTLPFLSWRQVLVGDPLYRPFANRASSK